MDSNLLDVLKAHIDSALKAHVDYTVNGIRNQLEESMEKLKAQHREEMQVLKDQYKEEIMALYHQTSSSMSPVLEDKQWMSESSLMNHQKPLEEHKEIVSSLEMSLVARLDDMIRSPPHLMLGDSSLRSHVSIVDSMIRSRTVSSKTEFDFEIPPPTSQQGQAQPQTLQLSSTASSSSEFNFEISTPTYQQAQTQLQTLQNQTQTIFRRQGQSGLDNLAHGFHPLKNFVEGLGNFIAMRNSALDLKREQEDLIATRNSVQDRVALANKQKIDQVVLKWLKDADIVIEDVNNLLNKAITKKNLILRYQFRRKLANKKKELEELIREGGGYLKNIAQLQRIATLPPETLFFPADKYLKFESREYAFKQVMEAVKDEEINMIGLYGMGGCGKTTLAEEVMKIAEAQHLFDKVLFVTVSSSVKVRRIQERIASSMQYTFEVKEEKERATALYDRLTQENKILVILDDMWQILDFGAIGIPLPEHHKGCKVLITTRSERICVVMECQKKIPLHILTDGEAWTLFQKQASISEDTSENLKHLGREISYECRGLPVAIAAVAGSLNGKNEVIWRAALYRLRNSEPLYIEHGLRDPYNCLKLSYDNLDTEEAKSLFLLCSVFPDDYKISIEDLIQLAIGLGVVEVHPYHAARSEVIAAKIKLVSSSLLTLDDDDDNECVKMHDLVRDVAHFIAENENKVIKCQLDNDVTLEQSSIRYLWCRDFPNGLDCSNLEFLRISTTWEILDENFKRMAKLRVLILHNAAQGRRPLSTMSFETFTNLRCLILHNWQLSDISFVRYTKKLQSLSLYRCSLPSFLDLQTGEFYKQLKNLTLFELFGCEMERNNYNVIGRMAQLEELCVIDRNEKWDDCIEDTIEFFKTFTVSPTLQCYVITLGDLYGDEDDDDWQDAKPAFSREGILMLPCFHVSNDAIMGLAKRAKILGMANIEGGAKNIIPHIFPMKEGSINKLTDLYISFSEEIECLVDTSNHLSEVGTLFSKLLQLRIIHMNSLRVLWHGCLSPCETFSRLKELYLKHCPELTSLFRSSAGSFTLPGLITLSLEICPKLSSLFTESTARTLISLEKVIIKGCDGLKHIVTERVHEKEKEDITEDDYDLQRVISIFPSLKTVDITKCANLEVIFPLSSLSELMSLEIRECKKLKQIMERDLEEDKYLSNLLSTQPPFAKLTKLVVEKCPKLKRVFSTSASIGLSNLEILIINGAAELEELIGCEHGKGHEIKKAKVELPKLKLTILLNLPNLCQGIELLVVKHRIVNNCPKLALTSTTSLLELYEDFPHSDFENAQLSREELHDLIDQTIELDEVLTSRDTSELPLLQISEEVEKEFTGEFDGSTTTLTNVELNEMSSPDPLDISHGETNIKIREEVEKEFTGKFDGSITTSANLELNGMSSPDPLNISHETSIEISEEVEKEFTREFDGSAVNNTTTSRNLELNGMSSPDPLDISRGETNIEISEEVEKEFIREFDGSVVHATTTSTNLELNGMSSLNPLDISQGETITQELLGVKGSSSVNGGFGLPALITGHAQAAGVPQYIGEVVPAPAPPQPSNPSPQVDLTSLISRLDQQAAFNREQAEFVRHHFHSMGQYLTHQMQDQRQLYTAIQQLTPPEQPQLPPWPDRPTYHDFFQSQWGYPPSGPQ